MRRTRRVIDNMSKRVRRRVPKRVRTRVPKKLAPWREKIHEVIFGADTFWGLAFDLTLLVVILLSVTCICLETVRGLPEYLYDAFYVIEWVITFLFTIEYFLRIICVRRPFRYVFSFFGIIDLLSTVPSYVAYVGFGVSFFAILRALRLLRVFRLLRLTWLTNEAEALKSAVWKSRAKIVVFLSTILIAVTIAGAIMYEIEKAPDAFLDQKAQPSAYESKFTSIPDSMYWAVVTMTTVGYGDMFPTTPAGKAVAACLILLGYSLIIVPTGFVSAELISLKDASTNISCPNCVVVGHDRDAVYCKSCGATL